jgi:hypothetical protein
MRTLILVGWLLVPIGFGIWHQGPGQDRLKLDAVGKMLAEANRLVQAEEWGEAVEWYDEALKQLPPDRVSESQSIRLEKAKAQMMARQLPEAHQDLKNLCEELQSEEPAQEKLLADARSALAQAQYYMTWLMRLEGQPRDVWEPEIEASRQNYRLLAEKAGDEEAAKKSKEDLESAVRLARMELSELQGLPLPSQ